VVPLVFSVVISLTKWNMIQPMEFIGLDNYRRALFNDPVFWQSVWNTFLLFFILSVPLTLFVSLAATYFFGFKYRKYTFVYQLFSLLPYFTSSIVIGVIFSFLFGRDLGIINGLLVRFGILKENFGFLDWVWSSRSVVLLINMWQWSGYTALLFISGLSSISGEMIEAAKLDGAGDLKVYVNICLPNMANTITFVVMTSIIGGMQIMEAPYMLFSGPFSSPNMPIGGPERSSLTMVLNFYTTAFKNFQYSYASAISVLIAFFVAIFSFIYYVVLPRIKDN
jgi:ABC-type sugar transport system permease subunit